MEDVINTIELVQTMWGKWDRDNFAVQVFGDWLEEHAPDVRLTPRSTIWSNWPLNRFVRKGLRYLGGDYAPQVDAEMAQGIYAGHPSESPSEIAWHQGRVLLARHICQHADGLAMAQRHGGVRDNGSVIMPTRDAAHAAMCEITGKQLAWSGLKPRPSGPDTPLLLARRRAGLSVRQCVAASGIVDPNEWAAIEHGEVDPGPEIMAAMMAAVQRNRESAGAAP